jgi:hypothetical protein
MPRNALVLGTALLVGLVPSLFAQSGADPSPGLDRELAAEAATFGPGTQDLWVIASKFAASDTAWNPSVSGFWAVTSPAVIQAAVELPAGALITRISCYYRDVDVTTGPAAFVYLRKGSYNKLTNTPSIGQIGVSLQSGLHNGHHVATAVFNETIRYRVGDFQDYYTLFGGMVPDVGFRGCRIEWKPQVTPAPASATFADVPTNHPYFRFVEALSASGITGGCGGGLYCVNSPITRGEMAVFLAAALGLHFPN